MKGTPISITPGRKIFFASDFHLGSPDFETSLAREKKVVRWLDSVKNEAAIIFILGDIFDFWFEYTYTIPKGFTRLQGKFMELRDAGIEIIFFTGNHDMWMFDYFPKEFGIPVYRNPVKYKINEKSFYIGHGDGLGPGDQKYKLIKRVFENRFSQWLFGWLHPNIGVALANRMSKSSRQKNLRLDKEYLGDKEWLLQYCRDIEAKEHHDFYIFGHRHLSLDIPINPESRYINLGDWMSNCTYGSFDGSRFALVPFEK